MNEQEHVSKKITNVSPSYFSVSFSAPRRESGIDGGGILVSPLWLPTLRPPGPAHLPPRLSDIAKYRVVSEPILKKIHPIYEIYRLLSSSSSAARLLPNSPQAYFTNRVSLPPRFSIGTRFSHVTPVGS